MPHKLTEPCCFPCPRQGCVQKPLSDRGWPRLSNTTPDVHSRFKACLSCLPFLGGAGWECRKPILAWGLLSASLEPSHQHSQADFRGPFKAKSLCECKLFMQRLLCSVSGSSRARAAGSHRTGLSSTALLQPPQVFGMQQGQNPSLRGVVGLSRATLSPCCAQALTGILGFSHVPPSLPFPPLQSSAVSPRPARPCCTRVRA